MMKSLTACRFIVALPCLLAASIVLKLAMKSGVKIGLMYLERVTECVRQVAFAVWISPLYLDKTFSEAFSSALVAKLNAADAFTVIPKKDPLPLKAAPIEKSVEDCLSPSYSCIDEMVFIEKSESHWRSSLMSAMKDQYPCLQS